MEKNKSGKKAYSPMIITPLLIENERPLLAGSIVHNSMIESVGHETGANYDFGNTEGGASQFNHDWESGS